MKEEHDLIDPAHFRNIILILVLGLIFVTVGFYTANFIAYSGLFLMLIAFVYTLTVINFKGGK